MQDKWGPLSLMKKKKKKERKIKRWIYDETIERGRKQHWEWKSRSLETISGQLVIFNFFLNFPELAAPRFNIYWHVLIHVRENDMIDVHTHVVCATVCLCACLHTCVNHHHHQGWVMGRKKQKEKQQLLCDCKHSNTSKVEIKVMTNCGYVSSILSQTPTDLWHANQGTLQRKIWGENESMELKLEKNHSICVEVEQTFLLKT